MTHIYKFICFSAACLILLPAQFSLAKNKAQVWHGDNKSKLQQMIDTYGVKSATYRADKKPVAVFDWDNTVIKNDVGDAVLYWLVAHGLLHRPKDWRATSPLLTDEAVVALKLSCGDDEGVKLLATDKNTACADTILSIYVDGKPPKSESSAWANTHNQDTMEPAYAWGVQLAAGYTPAELRGIAATAIKFNLANKVGATQKIGTRDYPAFVRIYDKIAELITSLQGNGFDVWAISASAQYYVEVFAAKVGIKKDHVIGIRPMLDPESRVTAVFEGCGTHSDGNSSMITYRQGKRCWANKIIFGIKSIDAMMDQPSDIIFGAGDSDTDIFFLKDAKGLRLAINRNKTELMCNAYANADGKWIVNPMFLSPKPKKQSPYDCAKFGLANQVDLVYGE